MRAAILVIAILMSGSAFAAVTDARRIGWATMEGPFDRITKYWRTMQKDSANLTLATDKTDVHSGKAAVRLAAGDASRAFLYQHWTRLEITPGGRYRISFWVRGKGEMTVYHAAVSATAGRGLSPNAFVQSGASVELTDSWQKQSVDFAVTEPAAALLSVGIELSDSGAVAFIDELNIYRIWDPNWQLDVSPAHPMIAVGSAIEVRLRIVKRGTPPARQKLLLIAPAKTEAPDSLTTGDTGVAIYRFHGNSTGLFSFSAAHTPSGRLAEFHIDVLEPEDYRQFGEIAMKVDLILPAHFLFIGDSLSDMQRGHNYIDKVMFWLRKRFGPGVTFKNAGIGGDDITRVWNRMNGNMSQYERERYPQWQPLLEPKPNRVFFFLGHNDSKLLGATDWKSTKVPIDLFSKTYQQAVEKIQTETDAKVVIMSATSTVYEKTKAKVDGRLRIGQKANLFGKPEVLEAFNAAARSVAKETESQYLDVYEPTRSHPNKASLFKYDGIHVNNDGNRVLARKILRYLAGEHGNGK